MVTRGLPFLASLHAVCTAPVCRCHSVTPSLASTRPTLSAAQTRGPSLLSFSPYHLCKSALTYLRLHSSAFAVSLTCVCLLLVCVCVSAPLVLGARTTSILAPPALSVVARCSGSCLTAPLEASWSDIPCTHRCTPPAARMRADSLVCVCIDPAGPLVHWAARVGTRACAIRLRQQPPPPQTAQVWSAISIGQIVSGRMPSPRDSRQREFTAVFCVFLAREES